MPDDVKYFRASPAPEVADHSFISQTTHGGDHAPSSESFQQLFESLPDGVLTTDHSGQIVRANSQAEVMFGYAKGELQGHPVETLIPDELRALHPSLVGNYTAKPAIRPMGHRLNLLGKRKNGTVFPVDIMLSPLECKEGACILAVIRDMTEQKQAERDLKTSQQLLQHVIDAMPVGLWILDAEGNITHGNPAAQTIWGDAPLVGPDQFEVFKGWLRPSGKKIQPDEWAGIRAIRQGIFTLEEEVEVETFKGERKIILHSALPIFDGDGKPNGAIVLNQDITDRIRADQQLRESEERFRLMVEGVKDYGLFLLGPAGHITGWNQAGERIFGYKGEEVIGKHFSCYYTPEEVKNGRPEANLQMSLQQGRYEDEGWRVRRDGSRFWANVSITPLRNPDGSLRGFANLVRDFTERKRADEALLLQVTNVMLANQDIRSLLSAIAASLRQVTPESMVGLVTIDERTRGMTLRILAESADSDAALPQFSLPTVNTPAAKAIQTGRPLVVQSLATSNFDPVVIQRWLKLGMKSGCFIPLVSRGRTLGVLVVVSKVESAFDEAQVRLVSRIAGQAALTLDNAQAASQIDSLKEKLAVTKDYLEEEIRTEFGFDEIVGESRALKSVLHQVEIVAPTDSTVIIQGESGTGKELVARAIHRLSRRSTRNFVKLNCAAIPTGLLESELFGHERGAFTGAISQKVGRFELADGGTLFLDEIGDIPLELQPKLLRALQEREFERLGSTRTLQVDVRLIAATNRDLSQMVAEKSFRDDLYYRLNVFPIVVPPLRERNGDIPRLMRFFVQKHAIRMNKRIETIPEPLIQKLSRWQWPGNVRELENFLERAVILTRGTELYAPAFELVSSKKPAVGQDTNLHAVEREHIIRVLRETNGLIGGAEGAAARLGMKRTTLNSKMRKLGIYRKDL